MFLLSKVNKSVERSIEDYNANLKQRRPMDNEAAANAILALVKAKTILEHPEAYAKIEEEDNML